MIILREPQKRLAGLGCLIHKKLGRGLDSGMTKAFLWRHLILQEMLQPLGLDPTSST
jgi:hypothetical protein